MPEFPSSSIEGALSKISRKMHALISKDRDASSEGVVEILSDDRKLLDTGEIADRDGKLWGYRLYKGIPHFNWDFEKNIPKFALIPMDSDEYARGLVNRIGEIQNTKTHVSLSPIEQLALSQAKHQNETNFATSWSRDPSVALGFSYGESDFGVVLQLDIPAKYCVSQEKLKQKFIENGKFEHYPLSDEFRAESEREVTVFSFIDFADPNLIVTEERKFMEKNLPSVRVKFRR